MSKKRSLDARVNAERAAHEDHDVLAESHRLKDRFPHTRSYPSRRELDDQIRMYTHNIEGKRVLDYGCGKGEASIEYLAHGATVDGIDISANYIQACVADAENQGYSRERWNFQVMDAHKMNFPDACFDLIVGNGILHHLDAQVALSEIHRVLRPNGRVILFEPLADNPLLKLFRWLTPNARTEDESPFTMRDVSRLSGLQSWKVENLYCGVIEAPVAMVTSLLIRRRPDNFAIRLAHKAEMWLHKQGLLKGWNQYILFNFLKSEAPP